MSISGSFKAFCSRETATVLLQLCLWSQLGVLTRIYLDRLFNDGCDDGWGLCLTSDKTAAKQYGAEFFDLPANMLGCFVMGLLSTGAVLGLKSKKSLAILPASHHFQDEKELQVGLRTGYCGSLTTFASWELSLLQLLIGSKGGDGGQWQQWLWGYIIGFELAFASHLIGEHAALGTHRWLLPEGSQEPETEVTELEKPTEPQEEGEDLYGSDELNDTLDGNQNNQQHNRPETRQDRSRDGKVEMTDLERPTDAAEEAEDLYGTADSHQVLTASRSQQTGISSQPRADGQNGTHPRHRAHVTHAKAARGARVSNNKSKQPGLSARLPLTTFICALLCIVLVALWIVLAIVDSERKHSGRRQQWFALLFAPFGCVLRWLLSKLNTKEYPILPWFPFGTFAANMIACCIDFIIGGLTNRYSLGYWPMVILPAIRVGYAGSLSTVSTFIAEVGNKIWQYSCVPLSTQLALQLVLYSQRDCSSCVTCSLCCCHMTIACVIMVTFSLHRLWVLSVRLVYILKFSVVLMQVRAQLQGWPEKLHGYLYPFITIATGNVLGIALYGWSVWRTL